MGFKFSEKHRTPFRSAQQSCPAVFFLRKIFPKKSTNVFFWENGAKRRDFFWDFLRSFLGKSARSADFSKKNQIWAKTFFFGKNQGFLEFFGEKTFFFGIFFWEIQVQKKTFFFGKITKTLKKTLFSAAVSGSRGGDPN